MLIERSKKKTRFILPVYVKNRDVKINWYYDSEYLLFSAYRQLKHINIGIVPLEPLIK